MSKKSRKRYAIGVVGAVLALLLSGCTELQNVRVSYEAAAPSHTDAVSVAPNAG
ncbi:hypothetical protein [Mycobacterium asiaticum]|uniref:hypothetical protein n=1 Tax=Mycobacterium asiaticum TaxID=1790 RepID=UPI000AF4C932|nr:hypothetical protein [Mycobacterium asiaticum]